jgi:hypothetical protein
MPVKNPDLSGPGFFGEYLSYLWVAYGVLALGWQISFDDHLECDGCKIIMAFDIFFFCRPANSRSVFRGRLENGMEEP